MGSFDMMKTTYDPAADAFYSRFAPDGAEIVETREAAPGVMLDLDANGNLVSIEHRKEGRLRKNFFFEKKKQKTSTN